MTRLTGMVLLAVGLAAGGAGGYWYARQPAGWPAPASAPSAAVPAAERKVLYYRDPSGAPYWSAEPKKDASGRDYLPVYADEEISFEPQPDTPQMAPRGERKILFYRN